MKIQCDVCNKDEASVYCSADEAALCDSCDYGVHHANKLASKHYRFNLVTPAAKESPNCDICQEKRAFLFCQQDRAILCRDCDASIHAANEHTKKHARFLLTGVKLSAKAGLYVPPQVSSPTNGCDLVPDFKLQSSFAKSTVDGSQSIQKTTTSSVSVAAKSGSCESNQFTSDLGSTSSISEYLMETLPGWHVDDLLDASSGPYGFSKQFDDGLLLPFMDSDVLGHNNPLGSFLPENTSMWSSQVPSISTTFPHYPSYTQAAAKQTVSMKGTNSFKLLADDGFTVPQIISPQSSVGFKRSRLI